MLFAGLPGFSFADRPFPDLLSTPTPVQGRSRPLRAPAPARSRVWVRRAVGGRERGARSVSRAARVCHRTPPHVRRGVFEKHDGFC